MKPLTATLRLQFHSDFTLDHAVPLVPYFAQLGISHLYASPILKARAGSRHGYDVVDPTCVNPELGGEAALERLVAALRQHGMGLILDTVSNHMAVGGADNPWWQSLLAWGRRSPYAAFFDIQWHSSDPLLAGQLLLPFLGSDYGVALKKGEIPLQFDKQQGLLQVAHYAHRFPICPVDYGWILALSPEPALKALAERFTALGDSATPLADSLPLKPNWHAWCAKVPTSNRPWWPSTAAARPVSSACTCCWSARPTAWPAGAPPPTTSTGGASSTSTSWAACAWSAPWCSKPPMPSCSN